MRAFAASCVLVLLCLGAQAAPADEVLPEYGEDYVCDRDLGKLKQALVRAGRAAGDPIYDLAFMSEESVASLPTPAQAQGLPAAVHCVRALRALDLPAARRLARAAEEGGSMAGAWLAALVKARSGDTMGAQARLMAPPIFSGFADAFELALLGAALPEEDRALLVLSARRAVARAAQRDRVAALAHLGLSAAALDDTLGQEVLGLCVRALRRLGDVPAARDLLGRVRACGAGLEVPALALEAALLAWTEGRPAEAAAALRLSEPPAGAGDVYMLLSRAQGPARAATLLPPIQHARDVDRSIELVARLAASLGISTSRSEILLDGGSGVDADPARPRRLRAFFETRGCEVLSVAGDARGTDALLGAQIPFVLFHLSREGSRYVDLPLLVRTFDRDTGLWRIDEPDVERMDAVPRAHAAKCWAMLVVPADRGALLAPLRGTPAERLGHALETLRESQAAPVSVAHAGAAPLLSLYSAYRAYQRARREEDDQSLRAAAAWLEHSRRLPPLLGFEEFGWAQHLAVQGEFEAALLAYDRCAQLEGHSAELALARYAGLGRHGRDRAEDARRALDDALQRAPDDVRVLAARAVLHRAHGDLWRARSDLMRARDLRADSGDLAVLLCEICLEDADPDAALAVLDDAARQGPALAEDERLRGLRRRIEAERLSHAGDVEALRGHRRSREPQTRQRLAFELAERGDASSEAVLR